ncbi:MAG: rRNA (uracil1498-N3)-methyltransferase [Acidobacteriota bacterium]|jgi:16S rRNA (uracil1498-N3)-methyltransferase|nr:rRNA (uracil1498-N3)-methyltransferase [Acidobacteriota bacterium]
MTRRRFYAPRSAFAPDGAGVVLSEEESRHLRDVLRLRAGDEAYVFDGEGREFACVVAEAGGRKGGARLDVRGRAEPPRPESPLELTLAVALLKGEKFDLVVQKATELGAWRIVPVLTKRADVRLRDERDAARRVERNAAHRVERDVAHRVERWRRLALEAAKQSGRARVPSVETPVAFDALAAGESRGGELRILFAERGGSDLDSLVGVGLDSLAAEGVARGSTITALIGPEGGWDDEELAQAGERGWTLITLGGRTLRAETAAITACVLLQHLFGDLG